MKKLTCFFLALVISFVSLSAPALAVNYTPITDWSRNGLLRRLIDGDMACIINPVTGQAFVEVVASANNVESRAVDLFILEGSATFSTNTGAIFSAAGSPFSEVPESQRPANARAGVNLYREMVWVHSLGIVVPGTVVTMGATLGLTTTLTGISGGNTIARMPKWRAGLYELPKTPGETPTVRPSAICDYDQNQLKAKQQSQLVDQLNALYNQKIQGESDFVNSLGRPGQALFLAVLNALFHSLTRKY